MKTKYQGFLLFYDWCELMLEMSPKHCKMLLSAMFNYQVKGEEPPPFPDKIKGSAKLIFAQLRRRAINAENGRKGGEAAAKREKKQPLPTALPTASPIPLLTPSPTALPAAYRQDIDQDKTETKQRQDNSSLLSKESAEGYLPPAAAFADGARESRVQENEILGCEEECAKGQGDTEALSESAKIGQPQVYGRHQNVYLTEAEYQSLKGEIPDADGYIDHFSDKLFLKGYRYSSCFDAIRSWWQRDRTLSANQEARERCSDIFPWKNSASQQGSFDTNAFYEAAVARSFDLLPAEAEREEFEKEIV